MQDSQSTNANLPIFCRIKECHGVFADAYLVDQSHGFVLLFMSLWGRDTAVQELRARITLGAKSEDGLTEFTLITADGREERVFIGSQDRLRFTAGRVHSDVYGSLVHCWVYDERAEVPDRTNQRALLLYRNSEEESCALRERIWSLVRETMHLPLLDHWRDPVMSLLQEHEWMSIQRGHGVNAIALDLADEELEQSLSRLIKNGVLRLDAVA